MLVLGCPGYPLMIEDEQAGVPLQWFHPPPFLLSEPTPQHGDAVGEADDRFERDDNGHTDKYAYSHKLH